jgi:GNAT superfamily N-acetyltransferase
MRGGMSPAQTNLRLIMTRQDLNALPAFAPPAGWVLRWHEPGDETHWQRIHLATEHEHKITPDLFQTEFGADKRRLGERQCYLVNPRGEPVGTATAWFDDHFEVERWGRVHWVALLSEIQGRGLSKPLLSAVCLRLRELGHARAFLRTTPSRLVAINLYLRFGFQPHPRSPEESRVWQALSPQLRYPCAPG